MERRQIHVWVGKRLHDRLAEVAAEEEVSVSDLIRHRLALDLSVDGDYNELMKYEDGRGKHWAEKRALATR